MSSAADHFPWDDFGTFFEAVRRRDVFVILGVQGSGTKLISNILQTVFDVAVTRDRSLIIESAARLGEHPTARQIERQKMHVYRSLFPGFLRRRLMPRAYYRQADNYPDLDKVLDRIPIESPVDFIDFFSCYQAFCWRRTRRAFKSDDLWQHYDAIPRLIPHRRYITIVRDPRDNALSITNKAWGPRNMYTGALFVKQQLDLNDKHLAGNPAPCLHVKYETLLTAPDEFVRDFEAFAELEPVENADQKLAELGIRAANLDKYRRLPARDRALCEYVLADHIEKNGYAFERGGETFTAGELARLKLHDRLSRIPQKMERLWKRRVVAKGRPEHKRTRPPSADPVGQAGGVESEAV